MAFWRRRKESVEPEFLSSDLAAEIAWGEGKTSPLKLVELAEWALQEEEYDTALKLAQKARDRNHDFASALPGMTGRVPLREMVYHPRLYHVLLIALDRCLDHELMAPEAGAGVAFEEYRWMDGDWPKVFACGDQTLWGLFLSHLVSFFVSAYGYRDIVGALDKHPVSPGVAKIICDHALALETMYITSWGADARRELCYQLGIEEAESVGTLELPTTYGHLACTDLIDQDDIRAWLTDDRDQQSGRDVAPEALPTYQTARSCHQRPQTTDLERLRSLSLQLGVGKTGTNPDAWWTAMDLALYRWEVLRRFDEDTCDWVHNVAYDVYATMDRGEGRDSSLWSWQHVVDLYRYCYERVTALMPTISTDRPNDQRNAQGHQNFFAWGLLESLAATGDRPGWHAFAPQVHALLCAAHPQTLTAAQISLRQALEQEYGDCNKRGPTAIAD